MSEEIEIRVRFPNESFYDKVKTFRLEDFEETKEFDDCVFGWWGGLYVSVHREDYDKLKESETIENK